MHAHDVCARDVEHGREVIAPLVLAKLPFRHDLFAVCAMSPSNTSAIPIFRPGRWQA
jgi:hypothetical protein